MVVDLDIRERLSLRHQSRCVSNMQPVRSDGGIRVTGGTNRNTKHTY